MHLIQILIETVIINQDTLYQFDNKKATINFYNTHMSGKDSSEKDYDYIVRCMLSTYNTLKRVQLKFNKKSYSQSSIIPCWDHIAFDGIDDGIYKVNDDKISLFNSNNTLLMKMEYSKETDLIQYKTIEHNYQIVYSRVSKK